MKCSAARFETEISHDDYKNKLSSDGQGAIRVDGLVKLDYNGGLHTKCEREYFTIDMPSDDLINIMVNWPLTSHWPHEWPQVDLYLDESSRMSSKW